MADWQTLSDRINHVAPSATLAVDSKAKAMKAAGIDVIGFGAGEPNFPTPAPIVAAAAEDIFEGQPREEFHAPVLQDGRIAALAAAALAALLDDRTAPIGRDERLLLLLAAVLHEQAPKRNSIAARSIGRPR